MNPSFHIAVGLAGGALLAALVLGGVAWRLARRLEALGREVDALDVDAIDARVAGVLASYKSALVEQERAVDDAVGKLRTYWARLRKRDKQRAREAAEGSEPEPEEAPEGVQDGAGTGIGPRGDRRAALRARARDRGLWP